MVEALKVGENHFKDLLDWLEEISLRDGMAVAEILKRDEVARIASDPRLGRNDKLKRLKEELHRLRFPRLARIEEEINRRLRDMKLKPPRLLTVPAGLEGGAVTVQMKASSHEELKRLAAELARVVDEKDMQEIFALLRGEMSA
jgi:hypothetical protein